MSYCTPCPPCDTEYPLLCEPLETTSNGKRLVVEDSAACQKTIQTPVAQQVLKTDGAGNLTWTNGSNSTVLGKDSTGKVEFATLNSVLQSGPVDLGSQPLTTTGAITAKTISVTNTGTGSAVSIQSPTAGTLDFLSSTGEMVFNGGADGKFAFFNSSTALTKAIVFTGANVGIETISPTANLHVVGIAKVDGSVDINGLIGIGGAATIGGLPKFNGLFTYANNAAAVAGGLAVNSVYKTSTGELRIVV
jgi:hypothetical protein